MAGGLRPAAGVPNDDLSDEQVQQALSGLAWGSPVHSYPSALATNTVAVTEARRGAPEGTVVVADFEIAGRCRRGKSWLTEPGRCLAASVVIRPALSPEKEGWFTLLAGLAAARGIEEAAEVAVRLKWPDDVLVGDRKVAGVLAESSLGPRRIEFTVLTFRVTVHWHAVEMPEELRVVASSLDAEAARNVSRAELLSAILREGAELYGQHAANPIGLLPLYRQACDTIGHAVLAKLLPFGEARGTAQAVDESGALLLAGGGPHGLSRVTIDRLGQLLPAEPIPEPAKGPLPG